MNHGFLKGGFCMVESEMVFERELTRNQMQSGLMFCLYQYLFYVNMQEKPDLNQIVESIFHKPLNQCDPFIRKSIKSTILHAQEAINQIEPHLNDWVFTRLSLIEQAILILAYTEIKYLDFPKPVAIDIAVKLAMKFADEQSHKFINAVLEKI